MFYVLYFVFYLVDFGECLWVIPVQFAFWKIASTSLAGLQRESRAYVRAGAACPRARDSEVSVDVGGPGEV